MTAPIRPATSLPWALGDWDDCGGYDCMTGAISSGPAVLDGRDYGQQSCVGPTDTELAAIKSDAAYIAHAANAYPKLVKALRSLLTEETWDSEQAATELLRSLGEEI